MPTNEPQNILSTFAKEELSAFLESSVRAGLADIFDYTRDFPGFLADDSPRTVPFALGRAVGRQACRRWARGEGLPSTPVFDGAWGAICEPYLDSIGEYPGDGTLQPAFEGGKCAARYTIIGDRYNLTTGALSQSNQVFNSNAQGPLTFESSGNAPPPGGCTSGRFYAGDRVRTATGQTISLSGSGCSQFHPQVRNIRVTRNDGLPDNCGNGEAVYDPPNIPPALPPLAPTPVRLPGLGPVDVDVSFNPDGSINVSLPDLGIDLDVPNPFAPGGDGGGGTPPGGQGQAGDAVDVGPGDVADETDPSRNLVGVLVQIIETPPRANRTFNETESYTKGPYYVYFGGEAGLSLNPEGAIARNDQFYYAPEGANRFRVVPNTGFSLRVTPYYQED